MTTYKIIRFYHPNIDKPNRVIKRGLTLEEAQAWCRDPKTRKDGEWFDPYRNPHIGRAHRQDGVKARRAERHGPAVWVFVTEAVD